MPLRPYGRLVEILPHTNGPHIGRRHTAASLRGSWPPVRMPLWAVAATLLWLGAACGPATAASTGIAARSAGPGSCVTGTCYVAVSVATMWVKPWYPRAIDSPALGDPADPLRWVDAMSVAQKEWLVGRIETQAVYATRVTVTGHWGSWTHVAVPSQPTNRDPRGYPGWVPTAQLTRTAPQRAAAFAVIRSRTAWLRSRWTSGGVTGARVMLASYDTRLPLVRATDRYVEVTLIGGRRVAVPRGDVVLHRAGAAWSATPAGVLAQARRFLGLRYLWGGTSGFGYDCSGFTYAVFNAYGLTLSRDADQQAVHGTSVTRNALRPADLVFFRTSSSGLITHVGIYIGGGEMIDAPHTGAVIRIEPVASLAHYAGARRYLSR